MSKKEKDMETTGPEGEEQRRGRGRPTREEALAKRLAEQEAADRDKAEILAALEVLERHGIVLSASDIIRAKERRP